jgi:hypothetical protein
MKLLALAFRSLWKVSAKESSKRLVYLAIAKQT